HDHRSLDDLALARPLDLLQFPPGLGDEAARAASLAPAASRLRLDRLCRANLLLARAGALHSAGLLLGLLLSARAALRSRLPGHLAGFSMQSVTAAPAAVLLELDAVRRVSLR